MCLKMLLYKEKQYKEETDVTIDVKISGNCWKSTD